MAGGASAILLLSSVFWMLGTDGRSLVPGFGFMASLAAPVMMAWFGLIVRRYYSSPQWLTLLLALYWVWLFVSYCRYPAVCVFSSQANLFLSCGIMGYMVSPYAISMLQKRTDGSQMLVLLAIAALMYTCIAIAKQRLFWLFSNPSSLENLVLKLLQIADGISIAICVYFSIRFTFSPLGKSIGEIRWIRWILGIATVLAFIHLIRYFSLIPHYASFYRIIGNPVTVYLMIVCWRSNRKLGKKQQLTWKEVFLV